MRIGILGLQGAVREHAKGLSRLGIDTRVVKRTDDLAAIDGLILPGGESTTMSLLADGGLLERLRALAADGFPMFGTCAGMILLAKEVAAGHAVDSPTATTRLSKAKPSRWAINVYVVFGTRPGRA